MVSSIWIVAALAVSVNAAVPALWSSLDKCASKCIEQVLDKPAYGDCDSDDIQCICFLKGSFTFDLQQCLSTGDQRNACNPRDTVLNAAQEICMPSAEPVELPVTVINGTTITITPTPSEPSPTNLQEASALLRGEKITRTPTPTPTGDTTSALLAKVSKPGGLTKTQMSAVIVSSLIGFGLLCLGFFCIFHKRSQYKRKRRHHEEHDLGITPVKRTFSEGSDKCVRSSWTVPSTQHMEDKSFKKSYGERSMRDTLDEGLGLGKELGYTSSEPVYPNPTAKTQVATSTVFSKTPERISLTYAPQPQRPSLTVQSPVVILPQATVDDYSPSSDRNSQQFTPAQHENAKRQSGCLHPTGNNVPLMFFTPATPQMNVSPVSANFNRSSAGDIFDAYAQMGSNNDNHNNLHSGVGIAQTTPIARGYPPNPPSYEQAQLPNNFPLPPGQTGLVVNRRNSRGRDRNPGPPPTNTAPNPPEPAYGQGRDLSAVPSTINRGNSQQWRQSVERAADKAIDRVRNSIGSRCEDVPEEEERLTGEGEDDTGRGRTKYRRSGSMHGSHGSMSRRNSRRGASGSSVSPAPRASTDSSASRSRSRRSQSSSRALDRTASRRASGAVMMV